VAKQYQGYYNCTMIGLYIHMKYVNKNKHRKNGKWGSLQLHI